MLQTIKGANNKKYQDLFADYYLKQVIGNQRYQHNFNQENISVGI